MLIFTMAGLRAGHPAVARRRGEKTFLMLDSRSRENLRTPIDHLFHVSSRSFHSGLVSSMSIKFPFALPTLQTCFALYRLGIQRKFLEPDEPGNSVCLYEGRTSPFAMGLDAPMKIGGHSDVERAVAFASQDVDEAAWHCRTLSYRARRSQGGADAPRLDGRVKPGHGELGFGCCVESTQNGARPCSKFRFANQAPPRALAADGRTAPLPRPKHRA